MCVFQIWHCIFRAFTESVHHSASEKCVIFQFILYYLFSELRAVSVCFRYRGNKFSVP